MMRFILLISLTLTGISFRASATALLPENTIVYMENEFSYLFSQQEQTPEKPGFSHNRKADQPPARRVRRRTRRRVRRRVERRTEKAGVMQVQQQDRTMDNLFTAVAC
jgi:hypothetical protein